MHTLWGDEIPQPTTTPKHTQVRTTSSTIIHTAADCMIFGHDWQTIGLSGEKKCRACGKVGYCPGCTEVPPPNAQPFFCSRHTPTESTTVEP
jgi:hypothetical protein